MINETKTRIKRAVSKKYYAWLVVVLAIITIAYSINKTNSAPKESKELKELKEQTENIRRAEDNGEKVQDKIITDSITLTEDNIESVIKRNKITKKAEVEITYSITKEDEYADFFGEKVAMAPLMFNMHCSLLTMSMFDPERMEELAKEWALDEPEKEVKDEEIKNHLDDYTVQRLLVKFIDAENGEDIAHCESRMAGDENIKTRIFRDYSDTPSFLDIEIGKFNKDN